MGARRRAVLAASVAGALVLGLSSGAPASAVQFPQTTLVSATPAAFTPNILDNADQVNDPAQVNSIAQIGNTMVVGGTFHQVQEVGAPTPVTRDYLLAFDATTGVVSTTFVPTLDGEVDALASAGDGTSVFVAGGFKTVDGTASQSITRLDLATGAITAGFHPAHFDAEVRDLRLVRGQLVVAGPFAKIGQLARGQLASLDPTTGAVTGFVSHTFGAALNGGPLKVVKIDVTPDGSKLLGIGNFTTVDGLPRSQVFVLDTSGATATLSTWQTSFFAPGCAVAFDSYMRDLDISPDGTYAVISTTGGPFLSQPYCDTVSRWDLTTAAAGLQPTWRNVTGGDTTYAVAVTSTAVYAGGHFRWANNPYGSNSPGAGAVPRQGLEALDPQNGLPLTWDPGRDRGVGVFDMVATSTGLWVGSDTNHVGGATHQKIAYFPLAGGLTPPLNQVGLLPDDVYLLGAATSAPGVTPATFADTVDRQFWIGPGHSPDATDNPALGVAWSGARGSFLVDGTVYSPWADGTVAARSFDGTTMGAPVSVPLYLNGTTDKRAFAYDVPTITGIFYANSRVYYTLAGDSNVYTRAFTPQSQVFGAARTAIGSSAAVINPANVASMFISGTTIYFASAADGHLYRASLAGGSPASAGTITGPATLADSSIDWRSRAAFVWDGTPANHVNVPPTAVATAACNGYACTLDGTGSYDSDGRVVSYAWDFGDGATATGATATHTYAGAGTYTATLTATDNSGAPASTTVSVVAARSGYTAVSPCRVFDTRTGTGSCTAAGAVPLAPVGAGHTLAVKVTGVGGIPATATSVALNVTAVGATTATFVTVWPGGAGRPQASNLNVSNAKAVPNLVVVPVGAGGTVDFFNAAGNVNLVADLAGYFSPASTMNFTAVGPCRLFDTRVGAGGCTGALPVATTPLAAGTPLAVQVAGLAQVPADASAVVLNVTAVDATADTYLTVYPDGTARPGASNLNVHSAGAVPNLVIVQLGANGKIDFVDAAGTVNVIADVAGYFAPTPTAGYTYAGPCRLFDTRTGTSSCPAAATLAAAPVGAGASIAIQVAGVAGIPADATAVVINVTAVGATTSTFVTVYPDGIVRPSVSNLNVNPAAAVPNLVTVPIGADGKIVVYNNAGSVNVIGDIAGYFAP